MKLEGRVALVTGAGRRVGQAIALALGERGMRVAAHYHESAAGAEETGTRIRDSGGFAQTFRADLRRVQACESLIEEVGTAFGGLDVLINSAAVMLRTPIGSVTQAQWDDMFAINLRAPFFCAQAAAGMLGRNGGSVVNIADLAGLESWPAYVPHGISKAGVIQMTCSLARALAPTVRVNAVAPGAVLLPEDFSDEERARLERTTPLARIGTPQDVALAVVYLLDADYVTGETLVVDGGRLVR